MEFPNEILLKMLSSLLRNTISFVCKRLRICAEDPSAWKTLELNCDVVDPNFNELLSKYPKVQHIIIKFGSMDKTNFKILSQLTSLQSLALHKCFILKCSRHEQLPLFTKSCLTSLSLFDVKNCKEIFNNSDPQYLKQLNIVFDNRDDKNDFCEFIKKCKRLEELCLENSYRERFRKYDEDILNSVFTTRYDTLISFNINFAVSSHSYFRFPSCSKLTKLTIGSCSSFVIEELLYILRNLNYLTELELKNCRGFSKLGINKMLRIENLRNLTSLEITRGTQMINSNLKEMAKYCKQLLHLTLANCDRLTDDGFSEFARNCSTLISLSITGLKRVTGRFLLDIANEDLLQNLETLIVNEMYIEREYVAALKRSRPDLNLRVNSVTLLFQM